MAVANLSKFLKEIADLSSEKKTTGQKKKNSVIALQFDLVPFFFRRRHCGVILANGIGPFF